MLQLSFQCGSEADKLAKTLFTLRYVQNVVNGGSSASDIHLEDKRKLKSD
jgi:hypothetical protein